MYSLSSAKRAGIPSPSGNNVTALDISGELKISKSENAREILSTHAHSLSVKLVPRVGVEPTLGGF